MKTLFALVCILTTSCLFGQFDQLTLPRHRIGKISPTANRSTTLLPSEFSEASVNDVKELQDLTILKVYYIYTAYKLEPSFNQMELDKKRFSKLEQLFPEMVHSPYIEWELVEQTDCSSPEDGVNFFHGFVIVHRPIISKSEAEAELQQLESFLNNTDQPFIEEELDPLKSQLDPETKVKSTVIPDKEAQYPDGDFELYQYFRRNISGNKDVGTNRDDVWVTVNFEVDSSGKIQSLTFTSKQKPYIQDLVASAVETMPDWIPASKEGTPIDSEVTLDIRVSYSGSTVGIFTRAGNKPIFFNSETSNLNPDRNVYESDQQASLKHKTIYKGLSGLDTSITFALVMDVTGSMNPHIASLKVWMENNTSESITSYSFFNDGDGKKTSQKKLGATGGIYTTKQLDSVTTVILSTKHKGSGGERSESDIEAIIHAQSVDPNADAILLIGDNYSEIRDLKLLETVTKPVHVIVCAATNTLREDYLNIVKSTNGLLFWDGKWLNLSRINKGDKLTIGKNVYKYNGRTFKLIS